MDTNNDNTPNIATARFLKTDEYGNSIYVADSYIFLKMAAKEKSERLGHFDVANKRIIMNKEFYDFNERFDAYPFNEFVLTAAQTCDTIRLICEQGTFDVPISEILKYGKVLFDDVQDLSRHLFLDLTFLKKYKIQ